jgi:hypothetical protein
VIIPDWLGQNAPLPVPSSAFSANACQVSPISGKERDRDGHHAERRDENALRAEPVG